MPSCLPALPHQLPASEAVMSRAVYRGAAQKRPFARTKLLMADARRADAIQAMRCYDVELVNMSHPKTLQYPSEK